MSRFERRELEAYRHALLRRRAALFEAIGQDKADLRSLEEEHEAEVVENAQQAVLASLLDRFAQHERAELVEIDAALGRIAAATYGVCEACGSEISAARLEALPAARECFVCHRQREIRDGRERAESD